MSCPICGEICQCSSAANACGNTSVPRWLSDPEMAPQLAVPEVEDSVSCTAERPSIEQDTIVSSSEESADDSQVWRQEVAARLNQYQARRKPRPPRYPSLRLPFEEPAPAPTTATEPQFFHRATVSNHALALDTFPESSEPEGLPTVDFLTQGSQN